MENECLNQQSIRLSLFLCDICDHSSMNHLPCVIQKWTIMFGSWNKENYYLIFSRNQSVLSHRRSVTYHMLIYFIILLFHHSLLLWYNSSTLFLWILGMFLLVGVTKLHVLPVAVRSIRITISFVKKIITGEKYMIMSYSNIIFDETFLTVSPRDLSIFLVEIHHSGKITKQNQNTRTKNIDQVGCEPSCPVYSNLNQI